MAVVGLVDAMGWAGGGVVAVAYLAVSTRRLAADAPWFSALNILGAAMLGTSSLLQDALPSAGWNLVWVLIGVQALVTGSLRRHSPADDPERGDEPGHLVGGSTQPGESELVPAP